MGYRLIWNDNWRVSNTPKTIQKLGSRTNSKLMQGNCPISSHITTTACTCVSFWGTYSLKGSAWRFLKCFSWSQVKTIQWDSEFRDLFLQWGRSQGRHTESTSLITFLSGPGHVRGQIHYIFSQRKIKVFLINWQSNVCQSEQQQHVWNGLTIRKRKVLFNNMAPCRPASFKHDRYHLCHRCCLLSLSVSQWLDEQQRW